MIEILKSGRTFFFKLKALKNSNAQGTVLDKHRYEFVVVLPTDKKKFRELENQSLN